VDLSLDRQRIEGNMQRPAPDLPFNCPKDWEDSWWIYFVAEIPGLTVGTHRAEVTFRILQSMSDGYGDSYSPSSTTQTLWITAK